MGDANLDIRIETLLVHEELDDFLAIVGTGPVDGETAIVVFAEGELRVRLVKC